MIITWKTKDGSIDWNTETQCFTFAGESANEARHKHNKMARDKKLTNNESDYFLIEALNNRIKPIKRIV